MTTNNNNSSSSNKDNHTPHTHTLVIHMPEAPEGKSLQEAKKALIMIHGRGALARDMLSLSRHLHLKDYAVLAPQATNNSWYPQSFMADTAQNEPWLSSAIDIIDQTVQKIIDAGIASKDIYFFGFSQGACLTLEYLARHPKRYGGAVAIIGGLTGPELNKDQYKGDFKETPVFLGTSNPDFHVPIQRVRDTQNVLRDMHAAVTLKEYTGMGHTINQDEIDQANHLIFH